MMDLISKDTISECRQLPDGRVRLRLFRNREVVFEKVYNTWRGAKQAESLYIRRYAEYLMGDY